MSTKKYVLFFTVVKLEAELMARDFKKKINKTRHNLKVCLKVPDIKFIAQSKDSI